MKETILELSVENLKEIAPDSIFTTGTGLYPELFSRPVRWVAVRGAGFHDWAIYYHHEHTPAEEVKNIGDKCTSPSVIKRLVPCSEAAFSLYRF
jgi:hypothetical protein